MRRSVSGTIGSCQYPPIFIPSNGSPPRFGLAAHADHVPRNGRTLVWLTCSWGAIFPGWFSLSLATRLKSPSGLSEGSAGASCVGEGGERWESVTRSRRGRELGETRRGVRQTDGRNAEEQMACSAFYPKRHVGWAFPVHRPAASFQSHVFPVARAAACWSVGPGPSHGFRPQLLLFLVLWLSGDPTSCRPHIIASPSPSHSAELRHPVR